MQFFRIIRAALNKHGHAFHASHWFAHCAYFGAVTLEGHGIYATAAGVMLVMTLVSSLIDGE